MSPLVSDTARSEYDCAKRTNDRTHGQESRARFLKSSAPASIEGMERYLGSEMIRGVGPAYARKLVRAFCETLFDTIGAELVGGGPGLAQLG
jgi:hypothetical protein